MNTPLFPQLLNRPFQFAGLVPCFLVLAFRINKFFSKLLALFVPLLEFLILLVNVLDLYMLIREAQDLSESKIFLTFPSPRTRSMSNFSSSTRDKASF